jgi:uncharacterized membrane protein YhhN
MTYTLLYIAFILAGLDWIAVATRLKPIEYVAKPGTMLALLIWLVSEHGLNSQLSWFAAGLIFSLAGDIFLMLSREQFISGLVSFLAAHFLYLVGLNAVQPPVNLASLILLFVVGIPSFEIYRRVATSLDKGDMKALKLPVLAYTLVISLMLFSALLTLVRPEWAAFPALLVSCGALLFYLSDSILAWNKFVSPLPWASLFVIITYHVGQFGIILGVTLHFV